MFRSEKEQEDQLSELRYQGTALKALLTNLSKILLAENIAGIEMVEFKSQHQENDDAEDVDEKNDEYDEDMPITQASLEEEIEEQNEENIKLAREIIQQCAAVEKIIAEKSKITNAIYALCNYIISFSEKKEVKLSDADLEKLEEGTAAISTPIPASVVPINELNQPTIEELSARVDDLVKRFDNSRSISEKAVKLVQWVASKCKPAYDYALSKIEPAAQAMIRAVASTPSAVLSAGRSLFSRNSGQKSEEKNEDLRRSGPKGDV